MGRAYEVSNVWASAGGTESNLHFDGGDNWLCQISGEKSAVLYAAQDTAALYPIGFMRPDDGNHRHVLRSDGTLEDVPLPAEKRDDKIYAAVDEDAADAARFPAYAAARARRRVCRIKPGQCLGLPHHVWHNIKSEPGEVNLSLNFGFGPSDSRASWGKEERAAMAARMAELKSRQHLMRTRGGASGAV
jgi:hypothetical protein